jgi:hypothetical protein
MSWFVPLIPAAEEAAAAALPAIEEGLATAGTWAARTALPAIEEGAAATASRTGEFLNGVGKNVGKWANDLFRGGSKASEKAMAGERWTGGGVTPPKGSSAAKAAPKIGKMPPKTGVSKSPFKMDKPGGGKTGVPIPGYNPSTSKSKASGSKIGNAIVGGNVLTDMLNNGNSGSSGDNQNNGSNGNNGAGRNANFQVGQFGK